ncbi:unnamed protein product [Rhizophagus irregularis]|nr:unnamed protein product [Rhizophagus irregularis]
MECIIRSTFLVNETNIETYNDISLVLLPKFPPVIIAFLPNNRSDKIESIVNIHKLLLDFAQELGLHIISIGSNSAQVEFNIQTQIQQITTFNKLRFNYTLYNINYSFKYWTNSMNSKS